MRLMTTTLALAVLALGGGSLLQLAGTDLPCGVLCRAIEQAAGPVGHAKLDQSHNKEEEGPGDHGKFNCHIAVTIPTPLAKQGWGVRYRHVSAFNSPPPS